LLGGCVDGDDVLHDRLPLVACAAFVMGIFNRWLFQDICSPREKRFRHSENCFVMTFLDETFGRSSGAASQ
jgi:hypothetical protein